ncbi:hypothetical protein RYH80_11230 [Halobaculum sp. MBLA0147]|uniref:hypothetical protein n=1 Tax=Halobaculum sp. MBLA0147 TaxID=3079934 RepID=UPI0035268550
MISELLSPEMIETVERCISLLSTSTETRTPTETSPGGALLRGLLEEFPNLLTVGVGGFSATLGWRLWKRPRLSVADDGVVVGPSAMNDQTRTYRVRIENTGRRAAENCKPRLDLTVVTDEVVTDVSTLCEWEGREQPTKTTINVGEVAEFTLAEYDEDAERVRFPSGDATAESDVFRYEEDETSGRGDGAPCIAIGARELTNGKLRDSTVTVAAENASSVERGVQLCGSDGEFDVVIGEDTCEQTGPTPTRDQITHVQP